MLIYLVIFQSEGLYYSTNFVDHHSDLISGYGLIHSTALPDSPEAKKKRSAGVSTVEEQGVSFFIKDLTPKLLSKETRENEQEMLKTLYDIGVETRPTGIIGALMAMKNREDGKKLCAAKERYPSSSRSRCKR